MIHITDGEIVRPSLADATVKKTGQPREPIGSGAPDFSPHLLNGCPWCESSQHGVKQFHARLPLARG